jgi:hypothetical protein
MKMSIERSFNLVQFNGDFSEADAIKRGIEMS